MAEKKVIKVAVPDDAHLEIVRGGRKNEATHEILSSFEVETLGSLVRNQVNRALERKYGEDVRYEWVRGSWRDITASASCEDVHLMVHPPAGSEVEVVVGRDSVWHISIYTAEEWKAAQARTELWAKQIDARRAH